MFGVNVKILHVKKAVSARKEADRLAVLLREGWEIATELFDANGDRITILTKRKSFWSLFRGAEEMVVPRGEAFYKSGSKSAA